jgi:hypothetical protein
LPEHEAKEEAWESPVEKKMREVLEEYKDNSTVGDWIDPEVLLLHFMQWLLDKGYLHIKLGE